MAGSQKESSTFHSFTDPILATRLEAIKQLAGGFSDRVAVLDRDFNVIYANESAWSEDASRLSGHSAKCYQAFAHRNDPCGTCPATKMYESLDVRGRMKVLLKASERMFRHLLKCAGLFEEMRGARYDHQTFRAIEKSIGRSIHLNDLFVVSTNNQQSWRGDRGEIGFSEIRPAAP